MHPINENPQRIFMAPPGEIHEHPTDLPKVQKEIPLGPIEGWLVYAPEMKGDRSKIVGPLVAVVIRPHSDNRACIRIPGQYDFWYDDTRPNRLCWYQSGCTLRFIRVYVPKEG